MVRRKKDTFPVLPPENRSGAPYTRWLEGQLKVYELIIGALPQGVIVMLPDGSVTGLNASAERLLGTNLEQSFGRILLDSFRGEDRLSCARRILDCAQNGAGYRCDRGFVRHETKGDIPAELDVAALRDHDGNIVRIIITFRDLSLELAHEEELTRQAQTDRLSGCRNRWWFDAHFAQALDFAKQHGTWLGVVFIDLDNFKRVNDESYQYGDDLISQSAKVLSHVLRPTDALVRLGGDEFVFVAEGMSPNTVEVIVKRMVTALRDIEVELKRSKQKFPVTASIGVSVLAGHDPRINELLEYAQEGKRWAKEHGKDCIQFMPPLQAPNLRLA